MQLGTLYVAYDGGAITLDMTGFKYPLEIPLASPQVRPRSTPRCLARCTLPLTAQPTPDLAAPVKGPSPRDLCSEAVQGWFLCALPANCAVPP
jgi:hypothetical protein